MISKTLYSSGSDQWETPTDFFRALDAEFHFRLDAAASQDNAKCARYFTAEDDALRQDWGAARCGAIRPTDAI